MYIALDPFNKLRDKKGCRDKGWHARHKIHLPCRGSDGMGPMKPEPEARRKNISGMGDRDKNMAMYKDMGMGMDRSE